MPHSDIPGSKPAGGSPGLFAAIHVLHRLLVPRHPPCALASSASRSFEFTKPAGSMFSKKPLLGTSLGQEVPSVCICLLNYSSILQVHYQRSAEHQSWSLYPLWWVEPPRPALRSDRVALWCVCTWGCPTGHKNSPTSSSHCGLQEVVSASYPIVDSSLWMIRCSSCLWRCARQSSPACAPRTFTISCRLRSVQAFVLPSF